MEIEVPGPPSAPASVGATPADEAAVVEWTPPVDDGGSAITEYVVTLHRNRGFCGDPVAPIDPVTVGPDTTSVTVNGLDNGAAYDVAVTAANQYGPGPAATTEVTPKGPASTITGTVTHDGTGTPIEGVWVAAVSEAGEFTRGAETGPNGGYSMAVPSGIYAVEFVDATGHHTGEWYGGRPLGDCAGATLVDATNGTTPTANAGLALAATSGEIAGTVTDTQTGTPIAGAWVVAVAPPTAPWSAKPSPTRTAAT